MFNIIRRQLGLIEVKQNETSIIVNGIPADVMARDISRIWGTSKITSNMFITIDKNSFVFPLYFAPDIVYALNTILKDRSRNTSVKVLTLLVEKLTTETWLAKTEEVVKPRLNLEKLEEMVLKPLPFQMGFIETYNTKLDEFNLKGYLLAGAAGSGKTFTSLCVANCLEANLIIVVCPKNAVERVWETSIQSLFKSKQTYWIASQDKPLLGNERFIVGHYEALDKIIEAAKARMNKLGGTAKVAIILDESHNLNEIVSLRTEKFIDLCKQTRSDNVLWMSGTPIKALGSESIPLFRCIDNYFTEDVEMRFKKIYGKDAKKGLDILNHRIGMVSFKIEKKELQLRDPIMVPIKIAMPSGINFTLNAISEDMRLYVEERKKFYKLSEKEDAATFYRLLSEHEQGLKSRDEKERCSAYRSNLKAVIAAYEAADLHNAKDQSIACNSYEKLIVSGLNQGDKELFKHVKTLVKYTGLKIQGECLGRVLSRKRIECHVDMVAHMDFVSICESTAKKTVVFTSFVEALKAAEKACQKLGLQPKVVYGGTNSELVSILKEYESNPDINPLIATYNSLSTAVPLVMADTMITVNFPFRDYMFQQTISRIHRLGSDTQTYVYTMSLDTGNEPNISTRSADILVWSQKQVEKIMGIKSPFEVFEAQGLESLDESVLSVEDLSTTKAEQSLGEGVLLKIVSDDYDVDCNVTYESLSDLVAVPSYANW